jgi:HEPN domain-containing protein
MIATKDVRKIAHARLKDAKVLLTAGQYEGAIYLCGYAVELALKARICRVLKWAGYPATKKEFEGLQTFRTHDLDVLARLTGRDSVMKKAYFAEWAAVVEWSPETRYKPIGSTSSAKVQIMISAAEILLKKI